MHIIVDNFAINDGAPALMSHPIVKVEKVVLKRKSSVYKIALRIQLLQVLKVVVPFNTKLQMVAIITAITFEPTTPSGDRAYSP